MLSNCSLDRDIVIIAAGHSCLALTSLLEKKGIETKFIKGEKTNLKITYQDDLDLFKNLKQKVYRSGIGYDIHKINYNSKKKLNTFVSLFPANKPKYVLLVMLDEPKPAPNFVYEFPPSEKFPNGYKYKGELRNTSGWNTVVVAGKIIKKIGPILAINTLQASKNF